MTSSDEYVSRGGNVIEGLGAVTSGLKELRLNASRILVRTRLGGHYEYSKQEVRCIKLGKWKWAPGRWFSIELVDETSPGIWFGAPRDQFIRALEDRGWTVEID